MRVPGRRGHQNTAFRVACKFGLRHIPPNYSFKRTVQSLRDWSCRLTHALALMDGISHLTFLVRDLGMV